MELHTALISSSVPFSLALTAGGLAVVNPCAFPLLPAFLTYYAGAEGGRLPQAPTRALQGLVVGALVSAGFLATFALVGLPLSLGLGAIADAVPWFGLITGAALVIAGVITFTGVGVRLPAHMRPRPHVPAGRGLGAMFLFGVGYGAASIGCTLPIFLTLVGTSLGGAKVATFLVYGAGMALVLMALAVGAAFAREGIARFLRPLLPHVHQISGALMAASGLYLVYYWARIRFGNDVTLADDPIVGLVSRYTAHLESFANDEGIPFLIAAGAIVASVLVGYLLKQRRRRAAPRTEVLGP